MHLKKKVALKFNSVGHFFAKILIATFSVNKFVAGIPQTSYYTYNYMWVFALRFKFNWKFLNHYNIPYSQLSPSIIACKFMSLIGSESFDKTFQLTKFICDKNPHFSEKRTTIFINSKSRILPKFYKTSLALTYFIILFYNHRLVCMYGFYVDAHTLKIIHIRTLHTNMRTTTWFLKFYFYPSRYAPSQLEFTLTFSYSVGQQSR